MKSIINFINENGNELYSDQLYNLDLKAEFYVILEKYKGNSLYAKFVDGDTHSLELAMKDEAGGFAQAVELIDKVKKVGDSATGKYDDGKSEITLFRLY